MGPAAEEVAHDASYDALLACLASSANRRHPRAPCFLQCTKGFKCKFSHDLGIERKTAKADLFTDR